MIKKIKYFMGLILVVISTSCQVGGGEAVVELESTLPPPTILPSFTPFPTASPIPSQTPTPTATPIVVLDPEPIQIEFTADDGYVLSGTYYPADVNPAPLIVLMPWARGDQSDWSEIALWLQGRGMLVREPDYNKTWRSSTWFPEGSLGQPLAVFTFDFRECTEGCQAYLPDLWLLDVQAAMNTAIQLHGIDSGQILTAGASIGGDGAVYGCAWLNNSESGTCLGSWAMSPASGLTVSFEDTVAELINYDPPLPVYCLYGLRDDASVVTCADLPGIISVDYGYVENHGMELFQSEIEPDPLLLMKVFILESLAGIR
jgi:hypothetical protein